MARLTRTWASRRRSCLGASTSQKSTRPSRTSPAPRTAVTRMPVLGPMKAPHVGGLEHGERIATLKAVERITQRLRMDPLELLTRPRR
jgi:hypothetical protein